MFVKTKVYRDCSKLQRLGNDEFFRGFNRFEERKSHLSFKTTKLKLHFLTFEQVQCPFSFKTGSIMSNFELRQKKLF